MIYKIKIVDVTFDDMDLINRSYANSDFNTYSLLDKDTLNYTIQQIQDGTDDIFDFRDVLNDEDVELLLSNEVDYIMLNGQH